MIKNTVKDIEKEVQAIKDMMTETTISLDSQRTSMVGAEGQLATLKNVRYLHSCLDLNLTDTKLYVLPLTTDQSP